MTYKDMKAIEKALETMIEKTETEREGIKSLEKANDTAEATAEKEGLAEYYAGEMERLTRESAEFKTALTALRNAVFC